MPLWEVALDRGTHPSDPTAVRIDASNVDLVVTTIDASSGARGMKDGDNGALDWSEHRFQGPIRIRMRHAALRSCDRPTCADAEPEVILTVPTDPNGTSGSGARFVAMELTSTTEIFSFRRPTATRMPALPVDTDNDGVHDWLCWVTWYSTSATSFNRQGRQVATTSPPTLPSKTGAEPWNVEWERQRRNRRRPPHGSTLMTMAQLSFVAFGRKLHCFDGETGGSNRRVHTMGRPRRTPHRTWAAPAAADMDGDGYRHSHRDMLVSQWQADLETLSDGRALLFT